MKQILFCILIEQMNLSHIQCECSLISGHQRGIRLNTGRHLYAVDIEVQEDLSTQHLSDLDPGLDDVILILGQEVFLIGDVFRTDAQNDRLAYVSAEGCLGRVAEREAEPHDRGEEDGVG